MNSVGVLLYTIASLLTTAPKISDPVDPGPVVIADGTEVYTYRRPNNLWFDLIEARNGGTVIYDNQEMYVKILRIDNGSTVKSTGLTGTIDDSLRPPDGLGTGGSNGGKGGGPLAKPASNKANVLRRVDDFIRGARGGKGADFDNECPVWNPYTHEQYPPIHLGGGYGGPPGGAMRILADRVEIDGTISCNGQTGRSWEFERMDQCADCPFPPGDNVGCNANAGGGGAGGTLIIIANEFVVGASASIQANGGDGGVPFDRSPTWIMKKGYAGGGGRVKIYYETGNISPTAKLEARAGHDPHTPQEVYGMWAEDGSVYMKQLNKVSTLFTPSADVNNDGLVDKQDLFFMMDQWGNAEPTLSPTPTPTYPGGITPTPIIPTPTFTPVAKPNDHAANPGAGKPRH